MNEDRAVVIIYELLDYYRQAGQSWADVLDVGTEITDDEAFAIVKNSLNNDMERQGALAFLDGIILDDECEENIVRAKEALMLLGTS
ncbi:MAG: hypothetical protein RR547_10305 [Raoultibacter sp.]